MSFEVFRRHQRKLLAIFAILAMFGFVVSDSLPKLLEPQLRRARSTGREALRQDGLPQRAQRDARGADARQQLTCPSLRFINRFECRVQLRSAAPKDRDLVDALILQHEADRLGIPGGPDVGREFLKKITDNKMTRELFELALVPLEPAVSGEQLLADIANQVRIANVRQTAGRPAGHSLRRLPVVSRPERAGLGQARRGARSSKFLAQVPEPSAAEIEAMYDKYKDVLPDPPARRRGSRCLARSRSRSSRSTATRWPGPSRTS